MSDWNWAFITHALRQLTSPCSLLKRQCKAPQHTAEHEQHDSKEDQYEASDAGIHQSERSRQVPEESPKEVECERVQGAGCSRKAAGRLIWAAR